MLATYALTSTITCTTHLLRRFFLTCLFRPHLCQQPVHRHVSLCPRAEQLRLWLLGRGSHPLPFYEVTLLRTTHVMASVAYAPTQAKSGHWHLGMPGVEVWINPKGQPAERPLPKTCA